MASVINKRQQARNEKTLQELLKQPGNDRCADCFTRNPGWASWNLGVFLCVRCASLHRKLGTHISKVKSLSMDSWSLDQVDNMKKTGNIASNRRFNPKQTKPNIPIDADEVDGAMERFIREKYQHKTLCGEGRPLPSIKHNTGSSSGSSNDMPPPLPAKNAPPRLTSNLRSSSAMYTHTQNGLPSPPASDFSSNGSRRMAGIPEDSLPSRDHSFDDKLDQLRGMGFPNEKSNSTVLKGANGDMNRAVEQLMRLGEGGWSVEMNSQRRPQTNGISIQPTGASHSSSGTAPNSATPQHAASASSSSNPFLRPASAQPTMQTAANQSFEQSFQNMSIAQPPQPQVQPQQQTQQTQPLFPNNTGSWTAQHPHAPDLQNNPFLKTFTPPISPSPYQYTNGAIQTPTSNPFLRSTQSQTFAPSNPFGTSYQAPQAAQQAPPTSTWPYQQHQQHTPSQTQLPLQMQPTGAVQSPFGEIPPQMPQQLQSQNIYQQQSVQSPQAPQTNPYMPQYQSQNYFDSNQPQQPQQAQQPQQQSYQYPQRQSFQQQSQPQYQYQSFQQPQQTYPQQRQYHDKSSILALYNSPNSFPQNNQQVQQPAQSPPPMMQPAQRSVTMPMMNTASTNPFGSLAPQTQQTAAAPGHVSRESMAFTGGRPASPDAFSGLSARWT